MEGWMLIHRRLGDSSLWLDEPFTRGQAWVDLLMLANHTDGFIRVQGMRVNLKRGDVGVSEVTLSTRWQWSRGKVRRFIEELENEGMVKKTSHKTTDRRKNVLTVLNYETYQDVKKPNDTGDSTGDSTGDGQATDRRRTGDGTVINNDKQWNNDKEKDYCAEHRKTEGRSTKNRNGFSFAFLEDESHLESIVDFIDHRKAKKSPMTQKALELNYKSFLKCAGHFKTSFTAVVDFVVLKGWLSPNIGYMENSGFLQPVTGKPAKQNLSPRQKYMQDVSDLLENVNEIANAGCPGGTGEIVESLPGVRPQRHVRF